MRVAPEGAVHGQHEPAGVKGKATFRCAGNNEADVLSRSAVSDVLGKIGQESPGNEWLRE
jgi:hypothetical protein